MIIKEIEKLQELYNNPISILYILDLIKYGRVGGRALFSDICILNKYN